MAECTLLSKTLVSEYNYQLQEYTGRSKHFLQFKMIFGALVDQKLHDPTYFVVTAIYFLTIALLASFVFFQLPDGTLIGDAATLQALYLIRQSIMILSVQTMTTCFSKDRLTILSHHYYGHRFSGFPVFYSRLLVTMPFRWIMTVVCSFIIYPVVGLRNGANYFLVFLLSQLVQETVAVSSGMVISALVPNPQMSALGGAVFLTFNAVFGGQTYNRELVPWGIRWLQFLSILYYTGVALGRNELDGVHPGEALLITRDLQLISIWAALGALMGLFAINMVIGPLALNWTSRRTSRFAKS